jgi:hypothetical protein
LGCAKKSNGDVVFDSNGDTRKEGIFLMEVKDGKFVRYDN